MMSWPSARGSVCDRSQDQNPLPSFVIYFALLSHIAPKNTHHTIQDCTILLIEHRDQQEIAHLFAYISLRQFPLFYNAYVSVYNTHHISKKVKQQHFKTNLSQSFYLNQT